VTANGGGGGGVLFHHKYFVGKRSGATKIKVSILRTAKSCYVGDTSQEVFTGHQLVNLRGNNKFSWKTCPKCGNGPRLQGRTEKKKRSPTNTSNNGWELSKEG